MSLTGGDGSDDRLQHEVRTWYSHSVMRGETSLTSTSGAERHLAAPVGTVSASLVAVRTMTVTIISTTTTVTQTVIVKGVDKIVGVAHDVAEDDSRQFYLQRCGLAAEHHFPGKAIVIIHCNFMPGWSLSAD